jgi:putative transposase
LYQGTTSVVPLQRNNKGASAPVMSKPLRNAAPEDALSSSRTFFVTTKTSMGRRLLQSERHALLFITVLRDHATARRFVVHDFVVMPDHVHVLITVDSTSSIEKAVQLIKGGFSYRLRKELGYNGEVWQRGFSEVRVSDRASFLAHRRYIAANPVNAGLADIEGEYPFCYAAQVNKKQGLKPHPESSVIGTAEAVP